MNTRVLTRDDFLDDASKIGCNVAAIRAVAEVESSGSGFDLLGRPKTLFEGHIFYKLTKGKFAASHPSICYPKWTRQFYGKTRDAEWARLQLAISLDRNAALMSASWGTFQIMGSNYAICGFASLEEFVQAQYSDANTHLQCFTEFVLDRGLSDELRDLRWADFARIYNGASYRLNNYDIKMSKAYSKFIAEEEALSKQEAESTSYWQPVELSSTTHELSFNSFELQPESSILDIILT
jgi:hypothetical protein